MACYTGQFHWCRKLFYLVACYAVPFYWFVVVCTSDFMGASGLLLGVYFIFHASLYVVVGCMQDFTQTAEDLIRFLFMLFGLLLRSCRNLFEPLFYVCVFIWVSSLLL